MSGFFSSTSKAAVVAAEVVTVTAVATAAATATTSGVKSIKAPTQLGGKFSQFLASLLRNGLISLWRYCRDFCQSVYSFRYLSHR